MRIMCDLVLSVRRGALPGILQEMYKSGCRIEALEMEEDRGTEELFRAAVSSAEKEGFEAFMAHLNGAGDACRVVSASHRVDALIEGGLLNVTGKAPIEGKRDLDINVIGAAEIISSRVAAGHGAGITGVSRNTAFVSVERSGEGFVPGESLIHYVMAQRDAVILNRFTGLNAFPLMLSVSHPEDIARGLAWMERGFSLYRMMNSFGTDLLLCEQLAASLNVPVIFREADELPLYMLAVIEKIMKKNRLQADETTVGVIGIDMAAVRLARLLEGKGFGKVLGFDQGEREMLALEDNGGLATTVENIFSNSDITLLLKDNFSPEEFNHVRPGQIVLSFIGDRREDATAARGKGVREFISVDGGQTVSLFPGLLAGMLEHSIRWMDDAMITGLATALSDSLGPDYRPPDCFSGIHERVARLLTGEHRPTV